MLNQLLSERKTSYKTHLHEVIVEGHFKMET